MPSLQCDLFCDLASAACECAEHAEHLMIIGSYWRVKPRQICQRRAPALLATWSCGVGPLLRFAVLVPRDQWLRDPADWEADGPVVQLDPDGPEGPMTGFEALPMLESLLRHLITKYDDAPMMLAGAFTWSDGAGGTLRERPGREVVLCSGAGVQLCTRFGRLFVEVCRGDRKPVAAAQDLLMANLSKKMVSKLLQGDSKLPAPPPVEVPESVRHVQPLSVTLASPLMALRRAQIETLGGPPRFAEALARTQLAKDHAETAVQQKGARVLLFL